MPSQEEIHAFLADGYAVIRGAVPAMTVTACRDIAWASTARHARLVASDRTPAPPAPGPRGTDPVQRQPGQPGG